MPYSKTTWKDRAVEHPRTYTIQDNGDGTITLVPAPGTVYEQGTPVNAANLNKIEQGIADATATAEAALPRRIFTSGTYDFNNRGDGSFIEEVKSNASITFQNGPPGVTSGTLIQGEGSHSKWQMQFYMMQGNDRKIFYRTSVDASGTKIWRDWVELITSAGGQTINGKLSLGNLNGEKLYAYENGNTKAGFGFNMTEATNELAIFHSSPTGSQGRITFGKRLDDGTFVKYATFFSDGKLLVSEGTYGTTARLQVGDGKYGLGAENSKLYLVSEFGEIRVANASGVDVGRVWDSSLLRNNNGLLELYYGGEWVPVSGAFIPFSERKGASGQPSISPANTWVTLANLSMRGRLEKATFRAIAPPEDAGYNINYQFRVTVDGKIVWQPSGQVQFGGSDASYTYLGSPDAEDYLYFNSNFKLEALVDVVVPGVGSFVNYELFYRQAI